MEDYIALILFCLVLGLMGLALWWQLRGLNGQDSALSHIDESLALSRRAVELQEETNALLRELLQKNQ